MPEGCEHIMHLVNVEVRTRFGVAFAYHVHVPEEVLDAMNLPECAVVVQPAAGRTSLAGVGFGSERTRERAFTRILDRARAHLLQEVERAQEDRRG